MLDYAKADDSTSTTSNEEQWWGRWFFFKWEVSEDDDNPWIVGFCTTHHKAFRCKSNIAKEYAEVFEPPGGLPHQSALARWPDGFESELSDLSVHEFRLLSSTLGTGRNKVLRAWEGQLPTGQKLWIAEKKDHKLLLVLYQESKALIYLPGHEHKELAMKVLIDAANEYIKNPCSKEDLKTLKATMWKAAVSSLVPMKRPAAAKMSPSKAAAASKEAATAKTEGTEAAASGDDERPLAKAAKTSDVGPKAGTAAPTTPLTSRSAASSSTSSSANVPVLQVAPGPAASFMDEVYG